MRQAAVLAAVCIAVQPALAQQSSPAAAPRDCEECPELALVPPGQFMLGSAPDAPELDATTGE